MNGGIHGFIVQYAIGLLSSTVSVTTSWPRPKEVINLTKTGSKNTSGT